MIWGSPDQKEQDEVWQSIVEQPESFELLRTEVMLHQYFKHAEETDTKKAKPIAMNIAFRGLAIAASVLIVSIASLWFLDQKDEKQRLLSLNPYDIQGFEMMRNSSNDTYNELELQVNEATTMLFSGKENDALDLYDSIIESNKFNEAAWVLYFNRALIYYQKEAYQKALMDLDTVEKLNHSKEVVLASTWYRLRIALQERNINDARKLAETINQTQQAFTIDERKLLKMAGL